ncbi:unannotated protein [freshwater metagenome]|uniref:Unannotated protein n=1 Tax=freshwater metagenome TaxID=449393 RepID=A0A6J6AT81_9ZZZZ|nr:SRPBCC family protein [Actinomycetota bacterium]
MTEIIKTCQIAASPAQVWHQLADFGAISTWAKGVDHSALTTSQTGGIGAARRIQAGRLALIETVTVWQPEQELAYTLQGLPPVVKSVTNTWKLTAAAGGTAVSLTTSIDPGSTPRGKIAARILGLILGRASHRMLEGLETIVRSNSKGGATS